MLQRMSITTPQKKMVVTNSQALSFAHTVIDGVRVRAGFVSKILLVVACAFLLNACESSTQASASTADESDALGEADVLFVTIDIEQADNAILLSAELKNDSPKEIVFLPWGTPFEGAVTADFLSVKKVGSSENVAYTGIMVKRRPPSVKDFKTVKTGDSIEQSVDISKSYDFCANTEYEITYSQTLFSPNSLEYLVRSNVVVLKVSNQPKACP